MTTEKADLTFASVPYRIMHIFQIPVYEQMRERDKDFYERLEKAGVDHDWGDDNSGLFMKYLRRGSGYYIDVGAADLVERRRQAAGGQVDHLTETGVVLGDGTELPADLVVYATGYNSMNGWAAELISPEVADKVGKCWGLARPPPRTPVRGRERSATCGSRPSRKRSGSTAGTCTSPAITPSTSRCSSKPARLAFPPPSTGRRKSITSASAPGRAWLQAVRPSGPPDGVGVIQARQPAEPSYPGRDGRC